MIVPPPRMDTGVQPTPACLSAGGLAIAVNELGCMQEVQPELAARPLAPRRAAGRSRRSWSPRRPQALRGALVAGGGMRRLPTPTAQLGQPIWPAAGAAGATTARPCRASRRSWRPAGHFGLRNSTMVLSTVRPLLPVVMLQGGFCRLTVGSRVGFFRLVQLQHTQQGRGEPPRALS